MTFESKWAVPAVSFLCGLVVFWISLHCKGADWFISETHAHVIYSGLRSFREYPFFSFAMNGGAYFLQDPQSNLFAPAVPLIWLAGPTVGLRLAEGLCAALGVYAYVAWMRPRVGVNAALIGAVASVMGLGVLWKIAVGNDMFLWHLGLPGLLWGADRVFARRDLRGALAFGLVLGIMLLGPTFHSFTYLFIVVVPLFVLQRLIEERPGLKQLAWLGQLFSTGCAVAMLIASPKLASWARFPMGRPVGDLGVLDFDSVVRSVFDYSWVARTLVSTTLTKVDGTLRSGRWWGVEECAVALPPIASALALLGAGVTLRERIERQTRVLALILVACGIMLSCSWLGWNTYRNVTGGSIRVAPRCLGMTAFGMSLLAALGAQVALRRLPRLAPHATLLTIVVMLGSALWWTAAAGRTPTVVAENPATVTSSVISPVAAWRAERAKARTLTSFTRLAWFEKEHPRILDGIGYKDGFFIVGNDLERDLWLSPDMARRLANVPDPIVESGIAARKVSMTHLTINLKDVPAHAKVRLRALMPRFGISTESWPPTAELSVKSDESYLLVENRGDRPLSRVQMRVNFPISGLWPLLSLATLVLCVVALSVPRWSVTSMLGFRPDLVADESRR